MNENQQSPPRAALLLRNANLGSDGEALGGLLERFVAEGQSSVWFWRQAFRAPYCAAGLSSAPRW